MMTVLVFSDSHGRISPMEDAVEKEKPDLVIHLGDRTEDAEELKRRYPSLALVSVPGNCDYDSADPAVRLCTVCGVRLLLTHGHTLGVKGDLLRLCYAAREADASAALYGHTHCADARTESGVLLFNPGAIISASPSYGILTVEEDGSFHAEHRFPNKE